MSRLNHRTPSQRPLALRLSVAGVAAVLLILGGCGCTPTDRFEAGQPIGREELASISEAIFATEAPDPTATEPVTERDTTADLYPVGTVHWTESGTVYHISPTCHHIRKSASVLHGTVEEAKLAGKEKACSSCRADDGD